MSPRHYALQAYILNSSYTLWKKRARSKIHQIYSTISFRIRQMLNILAIKIRLTASNIRNWNNRSKKGASNILQHEMSEVPNCTIQNAYELSLQLKLKFTIWLKTFDYDECHQNLWLLFLVIPTRRFLLQMSFRLFESILKRGLLLKQCD